MSKSATKLPTIKPKTLKLNVHSLSTAVGDFIRYWGFRRIHGQIWTQIYLSKKHLSGAELVRNLGVSKSLVSPALEELEHYQLIVAKKLDGRTKTYQANPEVFTVIKGILRGREKKLIENAKVEHSLLCQAIIQQNSSDEVIDAERLKRMGDMIGAARMVLDLIIQNTEGDPLQNWSQFI